MARVLGISVPANTRRAWRAWLAPDVQPFFVERAAEWPSVGSYEITPELRDTYKLWRVVAALETVWLDEATFAAMPRAARARLVREQARHRRGAVPTVRGWADLVPGARSKSQADGHRFVWWPSLLETDADAILARVVSPGQLPTRHTEVASSTWRRCAVRVPGARALAGSFPPGSGPCCFGTVMAACGVDSVADEWVLQEPFEEWLNAACRPRGDDCDPGTVLVWRDASKLPVHAAVTLGDGWAFEKPSQEWSTARVVLPVGDVVRMNRARGRRLERHHVV